jgi:tetratricopeptide (TPR) repeat protein
MKESMGKLLELHPSDPHIQLWAALFANGYLADREKAMEHYEKAIAIDASYTPAYNFLGYLYSSMEDYEKAEKTFKKYIELSPDRPNGYDSYAELLLKLGRYDESIDMYKKAHEVDELYSVTIALGDNYVFKGDYDKAREYYKQYIAEEDDVTSKANGLYRICLSYNYQDDINNVMKTSKKARDLLSEANLTTNVIDSYNSDGRFLIERGRVKDGIKSYQKAKDLIKSADLTEAEKKDYETDMMLRGMHVHTVLGEFDKAAEDYRLCKEHIETLDNPPYERILNRYAAILEIEKGNPDEALAHLDKASQTSVLTWYYQAVALDKKGEKDRARELYDKVANWNVNSFNLGLVRNMAKKKL